MSVKVGDRVAIVWVDLSWNPATSQMEQRSCIGVKEVTFVGEGTGAFMVAGQSLSRDLYRLDEEDVTWSRATSGEALDAFKAAVALR